MTAPAAGCRGGGGDVSTSRRVRRCALVDRACGESSNHEARIAVLEAEIQSLREGELDKLSVRELTVVDEEGRPRISISARGGVSADEEAAGA